MKYEHILSYVSGSLWAILPEKMEEIVSVLAFRAAGQHFTKEEIQARIGSGTAPVQTQGHGIAVVPIRGTIAHRMGAMDESSGGASTERISAMLRQVMADASIGTVVLDVDSPGGTVRGVQELAAEIFEMRGRGTKRFVAVVNGLAASAAYWLASQADEIVSIPSGMAGAIGVFFPHQDVSQALEKEGVKITLVSAGKHKVDGMPFQPLSDEHKAHLQAQVDATYAQFVKDIARGRGVSVADVKNGYGEGRVLSAKDAKAAGLIDRIATMEEVIGKLVGGRSATHGMRGSLLSQESEAAATIEHVADAVIPQADGDDGLERRLRSL